LYIFATQLISDFECNPNSALAMRDKEALGRESVNFRSNIASEPNSVKAKRNK
jgi:hypothetical protein